MSDPQQCSCGLYILPGDLSAHLAGRRHRERLRESGNRASEPATGAISLFFLSFSSLNLSQGNPTRCDVCSLNFPSRAEFARHQQTVQHQETLARAAFQHSGQGASSTPVTGTPAAPGYIRCDVCGNDIHVAVWTAHTTRHTSYQQRAAVNAALAEAEKDKNGISVSYKGGIDFGIIAPAEALHPELYRTADVKLQRTDTPGPQIVLHAIRLASSERGDHYGAK